MFLILLQSNYLVNIPILLPLGNPGQPMGIINAQRLPSGATIDPQKMQRIQALQQELQREYREVGQVQAVQSVPSMGQQQQVGQETMIMSQPRMLNTSSPMQQPTQLRQVKHA